MVEYLISRFMGYNKHDIWEHMFRRIADSDCKPEDYRHVTSIKIRNDELDRLERIWEELSDGKGVFMVNKMIRLSVKFLIHYYENLRSPTPRKK